MTDEEIIEIGVQARMNPAIMTLDGNFELLKTFAKLVAEKEREAVANWLMRKGFATGHGDNIVDMLDELEWQVAEKEREECLKRASIALLGTLSTTTDRVLNAIKRRGQE